MISPLKLLASLGLGVSALLTGGCYTSISVLQAPPTAHTVYIIEEYDAEPWGASRVVDYWVEYIPVYRPPEFRVVTWTGDPWVDVCIRWPVRYQYGIYDPWVGTVGYGRPVWLGDYGIRIGFYEGPFFYADYHPWPRPHRPPYHHAVYYPPAHSVPPHIKPHGAHGDDHIDPYDGPGHVPAGRPDEIQPVSRLAGSATDKRSVRIENNGPVQPVNRSGMDRRQSVAATGNVAPQGESRPMTARVQVQQALINDPDKRADNRVRTPVSNGPGGKTTVQKAAGSIRSGSGLSAQKTSAGRTSQGSNVTSSPASRAGNSTPAVPVKKPTAGRTTQTRNIGRYPASRSGTSAPSVSDQKGASLKKDSPSSPDRRSGTQTSTRSVSRPAKQTSGSSVSASRSDSRSQKSGSDASRQETSARRKRR